MAFNPGSMPSALRLAIAAALAAAGWAPTVGAAELDVPAPPRTSDACSLLRVREAGQACRRCLAGPADRHACGREQAQAGFARVCRSQGESLWAEIWCNPPPAARMTAPVAAVVAPVAPAPAPRVTAPVTTALAEPAPAPVLHRGRALGRLGRFVVALGFAALGLATALAASVLFPVLRPPFLDKRA